MNPRRSILQPTDPQGSLRSGLPMPTSTLKKPAQNFRTSLASQPQSALRNSQSSQGSTSRQSLYKSQNPNPLLASASKPSAYGRTPASNNILRRGSTWGGGQQTAHAPPMSQKDRRELRDKTTQLHMRQDVVAWLNESGFDAPFDVSSKSLANITGNQFYAIFQHLLSVLDPEWPFADGERDAQEHFIQALRAVHYPFVGSIDPKWLKAPASMHSWPALLGALHWLADMGRLRMTALNSRHPSLQDEDLVPEAWAEEETHHHQAVLMAYYSQAYEVFLEGSDTYPEQDAWLAQRYSKKDEQVSTELDQLRDQLQEAKTELQKLIKSAPPMEELLDTNKSLKQDEVKYEQVITRWEARERKAHVDLEKEIADLRELERRRGELEGSKAKLEDVVRTQNLSEEEVIRMNTDHASLTRSLEDLRHKSSEASKNIMSLEVTLTNRVAAAEDALDRYTKLLSALELFPPLPPPLPSVDLTLELNTAQDSASGLLSGEDVRRVIKPALARLAEMRRNEGARVMSERDAVEHRLDGLLLECENLETEIREVDMQVRNLHHEADEVRGAALEEAEGAMEHAAQLQREVSEAKLAAKASGAGVQGRLQTVQIAYREQMEKVTRLREDTVRAIVKNITEIAVFKEQVSDRLKEVKELAEAN